jgi:hypothetical protein
MPFVREHSGSRTSGRGDYTAIVDGVRQIVLASTARTYSYFDALSRLRHFFFGAVSFLVVGRHCNLSAQGLRRRAKLFKPGKT